MKFMISTGLERLTVFCTVEMYTSVLYNKLCNNKIILSEVIKVLTSFLTVVWPCSYCLNMKFLVCPMTRGMSLKAEIYDFF